MPRRRRPLPSSLRWAVFTAAEARAAGVSGGRLRADDLTHIDRGLYAVTGGAADGPGPPVGHDSRTPWGTDPSTSGTDTSSVRTGPSTDVDDPTTDRDGPPISRAAPTSGGSGMVREADVIRALQRADPRAVACGLSAARLWKLPLPLGLSAWVMDDSDSRIIMNLSGIHRLSSAQVTWRSCQLAPSARTRERGIVITTRLRTFLDLADVVPRDDLVAIGDHLVRRPRPSVEGRSAPHVEITELADAVSRYRGRGARRLQSAMTDVRVGADSAPETALRLALLRADLPASLLNTTIREDGKWLGDPDMAWPQWKVCVEYDGRHHRTRAQQAKDIRRGERRRLAGWTELIVTVEDMKDDAAQAVDRVRSELRRRGWEG